MFFLVSLVVEVVGRELSLNRVVVLYDELREGLGILMIENDVGEEGRVVVEWVEDSEKGVGFMCVCFFYKEFFLFFRSFVVLRKFLSEGFLWMF